MRSFLWPLVENPRRSVSLVRVPDLAPVATTVEPAFDSATRRRGLLGRDGLAPGAAMIIAPCGSVHTFFMRFPIDVIFVSADGAVLKVVPALPAWRLAAARGAFATIEMAAGSAASAGLAPGNVLALVPAAAQAE